MTPDDPPLLPAPTEPLLLAAPTRKVVAWKQHPRTTIVVTLLLLFLLIFLVGFVIHHRREEAADQANEEAHGQMPLVTAVQVKHSKAIGDMVLPGSLTPIEDASLYARATGYVTHRRADIGDIVKKDQILADIDSPELDQQYSQSVAATAQARMQLEEAKATVIDSQAKLDLARLTLARYETLLSQDSIARQDVDTQRQVDQSAKATLASSQATARAAQEAVRAAEADQRRVAALQRFEQVRAPFDGVITARNVNEGDLIGTGGAGMSSGSGSSTSSSGTGSSSSSSGSGSSSTLSSGSSSAAGGSVSSGGTSMEMFHIAQVDRLRVYVNVPQESASLITPGTDASVLVQEFGNAFKGAVTRTSRSLDASSRTLLAEVQIDNSQRHLLPGMYAQVKFADPRPNAPLLVSGETLITRASGTAVAVLEPLNDAQRKPLGSSRDAQCARVARLQPVALGRDYGTVVEITKGLKDGDFVVLNPGDTVKNNAYLLPSLQQPDEQGPGGAGGGSQKNGQADDKGKDKDRKKDKDKDGGGKDDSESARKRRKAESNCIEQQAKAVAVKEAASASAAGAGAPSDQSPSGIRSPSITAPTQGAGKGRG